MAEENIKLSKTIYSTKSTDGLLDRSFSEFFKTKDPVNLDRFFSVYNELFYDIPKMGKKSHTSIIKQSQDYIKNYIDPRDEQITLLTERIAELEELLNTSEEEHPFFTNGTLIGLDENVNDDGTIGNGHPDDYKIYYMDNGKRRKVKGGAPGEIFQALKASLGYLNTATTGDIVKIIPKVVLEGITEGSQLDIEDVTGQTAAQQLESQLSQLSDIQVDDWRQELNNLIQPIENGSVQDEIIYINLLRSKIISEFQREGELESLAWKYQLDISQGFTQEEKDNGEILLTAVRPKLLKSRQTLAILKRIWDKKTNFPDINFDEILPSSYSDSSGNKAISNPLTEEEVEGAYGGWDEGRALFQGVLEGQEYMINTAGEELTTDSEGYLNISEKSDIAYNLLDQGKIIIVYKKELWKVAGGWQFDQWVYRFSHSDYQGGLIERYTFKGYKYN